MKVGDLVRRLSAPLRVGVVVEVDKITLTYARVLYSGIALPTWVSFELLEVVNESR